MALILNGSTQYGFSTSGITVVAYPFTMACWFNTDDDVSSGIPVSISLGNATSMHVIQSRAIITGDPVAAMAYGGAWVIAESTTGFTAGTWHHAMAVFDSTTSRTVYIDGGSKGVNTDSQTPSIGASLLMLGTERTTPTSYFDGQVAHYTIWTESLTSDNAVTLANGTPPLSVSSANIVHNYALISDNIASVGTIEITMFGSPTYNATNPVSTVATPLPNNTIYTKQLIAIGNDGVWYENPAGVMSAIAATADTLDTGENLDAWEGMGKGFVVNGSTKKVLDLINTKVVTSAIVTLPSRSNTLTGGTSGATLLVDYIDSSSSTCNMYGKSITTLAFISGETITTTNDDDQPVSFVLSEAQTTSPHWYDWTPYANDTTTYGTMPSTAEIGCLYRGRCVLAGDATRPYMWYMTRVIDPWDWKYAVNDPLSAIRGGNADAGEIGDVITTLIPFSDDYLIMGGERSVWLMRGDPAGAGGSIDQISSTTGMLSQSAWCIDGNNNIYFYGTNGLYSLTLSGGQGVPVNISNAKLPQLTKDWAIDNTLHKVVLSYDDQRKGIIFSKITLDGGASESYFYDLSVDGFFPETYPDNLSPTAPFFYKAIDDSYTGLLLGGYDGYIRNFVDSEKSDEDVADAIISSYLTLPILPIVSDSDSDAVIKEVIAETAGGAAGGTYSDTDTVDIAFYTGDDAETVLEDIKDGATAFLTVALVSAGRQAKIREHIRTKYIGIVLSNSVLSSSWAINKIFGEADQGGKK